MGQTTAKSFLEANITSVVIDKVFIHSDKV